MFFIKIKICTIAINIKIRGLLNMTIIEIKEQIEVIENNSIKRNRGIKELVAEWVILCN